jgi:hypothetical protein
MSTENYFTVPLAVLRSGGTELEALENAVTVGMVNAGVGFAASKDEDAVRAALEAARERAGKQNHPQTMPPKDVLNHASGYQLAKSEAVAIWDKALLGWGVLGIIGGNRTTDAQAWLKLHRQGEVFFKISSDFMWGAVKTARRAAGEEVAVERAISFREFRILAAILSAPTPSYGFVFLGWEALQHRACGYHTKELFNEHKDKLPPHCQPLTRSMIRGTCDRLEALGFFGRVRYSAGVAGGYTAYSVTLERPALIEAVKKWQAANMAFKTKIDGHRKSDQEAFKRKG